MFRDRYPLSSNIIFFHDHHSSYLNANCGKKDKTVTKVPHFPAPLSFVIFFVNFLMLNNIELQQIDRNRCLNTDDETNFPQKPEVLTTTTFSYYD